MVGFSARSFVGTLASRDALGASAVLALRMCARCLIPVTLVVGPIGMMLAMQTLSLTRSFGAERLLPPLLAATIIRELGPGFSAVIVAFQAGAGIAAELGTMRVHQEVDALEVMGLDAPALLVGPRILAAAICAPLLNALGVFVALFGAYLICVLIGGMSRGLFVYTLLDGITVGDLWLSAFKCVVFGAMIGAVSATFGYFARGGASGVGRAANRAVVVMVILILVMNYLLNTAIMGLHGAHA